MDEIVIQKNEEEELLIPHVWRPMFTSIVNSFVKKDYSLSVGINNVNPISSNTSDQIKEYIEDYGEELIELPEETWETSVYICSGDYWKVLIDLFTKEEGRSDLVLNVEVRENNNDYFVTIQLVYVP